DAALPPHLPLKFHAAREAYRGDSPSTSPFNSAAEVRLRVSIRQVDGSDQHPVYGRFDIACLAIVRIPRQAGSGQHRVAIPRQDRNAVPGAFAKPDSAIAEVAKGTCRK